MKRLFLLLATVTLAGCIGTTGPANNPSHPATETFDPSLGVDISSMMPGTLADDYYKDITIGTGDAITGDGLVTFSYSGYLKTGSAFASGVSVTADDSLPISRLVLGLQDMMPGMRVGGRRLFVVGSNNGYGNSVNNGIPANSTMVFDITLTGLAPVP